MRQFNCLLYAKKCFLFGLSRASACILPLIVQKESAKSSAKSVNTQKIQTIIDVIFWQSVNHVLTPYSLSPPEAARLPTLGTGGHKALPYEIE